MRGAFSHVHPSFAWVCSWFPRSRWSAPRHARPNQGRCALGTFDKDGQAYFALSLLPAIKADPAQKNEVVILVDTSASQAGRYRDEALAAVDSLLANLWPDDRVQLMAVDVKAVPMSAGFVAPGSPEMQAGPGQAARPYAARRDRPGGRPADRREPFATAGAARTVIYVGDAMSKANVLTEASLGKLVGDLRNTQGFGFGLRDRHGAECAADGGPGQSHGRHGRVDGAAAEAPVTSGRALAASVHASVIWPSEMKLSPQRRRGLSRACAAAADRSRLDPDRHAWPSAAK